MDVLCMHRDYGPLSVMVPSSDKILIEEVMFSPPTPPEQHLLQLEDSNANQFKFKPVFFNLSVYSLLT